MTAKEKMKIEIWSDVMCPFCYIGKRRFEDALQQFEHHTEVEIEWKSFQLNPTMQTEPNLNINQYLADRKGWTVDYARQISDQVTEMAAQVGLKYNFSKAIVANSFNAHRLSHLAKKHGLGDPLEEALFKAYFTDGKNIDDKKTLGELGIAIGLKADQVEQTLDSNDFADAVKQDIAEAQYLGIQSVPFYVLNDKFGISGAQSVPVFSETLEKSFADWQQQNAKPKLTVIEGNSCIPDGDCG